MEEAAYLHKISQLKANLDTALGDANATLAAQLAQEIAVLQGELKGVQSDRIRREQEARRDDESRRQIAAISAAIDLINTELNQLRAAIKRGFGNEHFETAKWIHSAQHFNQRLEKQVFALDALVDMGETGKAERKAQVVRIGQYHDIIDQLISHLNHSSSFYAWLT